jgi:hypothetical protein
MIRRLFVIALVACASFASIAAAQTFPLAPSSRGRAGEWIFDFGGQMAQPIGAFGSQVDRAWGVGGSVRHHFRGLQLLGLRADVAWLNYGNENKRVPLSPTVNRVLVDMHTMNNIALFTAGPEIMLTRGPIRPYAYAFAGFSYFYTETSAGDDGDGGSFARSTNFDDGGWAKGFGGGLRIPVALRAVEAALDAGARLTRNGERAYLRRGDILDQPDGTLQFTPRSTTADFWQYHVGLSFSPRRR